MGAAGSPYAEFQRAIKSGNLLIALAVARQLPQLSLADSLDLCRLLAEKDRPRFERAAPRWHARFVLEAKSIELREAQATLGLLSLIETEAAPAAVGTLREIAERYAVKL